MDQVTPMTADQFFIACGEVLELLYPNAVNLEAETERLGRDLTRTKNLANAIEAGSDFRIAFRKPGEKEWTRIMPVSEEEVLRDLAWENIAARTRALEIRRRRLLAILESRQSNDSK